MNFTSPTFLFYFLPLLLIIYLVLPERFKNITLIVASAIFYFWGEKNYLVFLYVWVLINYFTSRLIYKAKKHSGFYLTLSIIINLGILLYFKYTNFLLSNLSFLNVITLTELEIHLPLALSFLAFHAISYNIDTYRKIIKPELKLSRIILYFTFFPHLIAGPIIRYQQIHDQLAKRQIKLELFSRGIYRFIIGLSKKVIIANTLAPVADEIFGIGPMHVSFEQAWLGAICFGLQIYYDFSGYTDMAIGLGLMFGFKFPENFNYPYISTSITEFWRRWHITLSNWFRDYLYYPLAREWGRVSKMKRTFLSEEAILYLSLLVTFALVGFWHGANWTFVAFGVLQGAAMMVERIKKGVLVNWMPKVLRHGYFLVVIAVSWVFFRSTDIPEALSFSKLMFTGIRESDVIYYSTNYFLRSDVVIAIVLGIIFSTPILSKLIFYVKNWIDHKSKSVQKKAFIALNTLSIIVFLFLFVLSLVYISSITYQSFIYFRF